MLKDTCKECYKIVCGGCGWEPNSREVALIQAGELTACPVCSWKPGENI